MTGVPTLTLETGSTDQTASYSSGTGTTELTFTYTVQEGDTSPDLDYVDTSSLSAGTGTLTNLTGNSLTPTLPAPGSTGSLGANKALVIDTTAPTVTNVSSSSTDGTYATGTLSIQVTMSEPVTVTGTPTLTLETGTTDRTASYASGTGTTELTFTYAIQSGDTSSDLDYVSTSSLSAGTSLIDAAGNNATLTLPTPGASGSLGANKALVVYTTIPTVTNVTSSTSNASFRAGDSVSIQITFSQAVTVVGSPALTLETGTTDRTATYSSGSGTTSLSFTYAVQSGDTSSDLDFVGTTSLSAGTSIKNAYGTDANLTLVTPGAAGSLGANKAIIIDTTSPTVTNVTSSTSNGSYNAADTISIQVTFSEVINVLGAPTLTVETGATDRAASYTSGTGTSELTFTYTVQAADASSDLDYIATSPLTAGTSIKDAAGNDATLTLATPGASGSLGANKAIVIDNTAPTVTNVTSSTSNGIYFFGSSVSIQVTFSEAVTVTGTPTLTLETGTTDRTASYASGSTTTELTFTYTIESGDSSSDLDYVATTSLSAGTSIQDTAGNDATRTLAAPAASGSLGNNKAIKIDATTKIASGAYHNCARMPTGEMKCWGSNSSGQLGLGHSNDIGDSSGEMGSSMTATTLGSRKAVQIALGGSHTCALLDDSTVKCWGGNSSGQLGQGSTANLGDNSGEMSSLAAIDLGTGRTPTQIAAGYYHSCALLDNATIKCWGYSGNGELGQGNTSVLGDATGEMGDSLPTVNLGTGRTATQIFANFFATCAILDNSTTKCWGYNSFGGAGQGHTSHVGDESNELGDYLSAIDFGTGRTATQISSGQYHTCATLDNATAKCFGRNAYGELGQGNTTHLGDNSGEMGENLTAIDLGTGRTATQMSAGSSYSCALLDNGTVKCWGSNSYGQLGQGNTTNLGGAAGQMGDSLTAFSLGTGRTATKITTGSSHACALLDNSTVKCWGSNSSGQLGKGNTTNLGDNSAEMGDSLTAIDLGS